METKEHHEMLANSVAGVIFLGTPHAGSSYSFLAKLYCLCNHWDGGNPLLLVYLDPNSKETKELEDQFLKYYPGCSIDFYETKPTTILGLQVQMVTAVSETSLFWSSG
jgi:hypothetical protein